MRWVSVAVAGVMLAAACTPGEGPESIPLPTSPDTTTTTTTTTTTSTTSTTSTTMVPSRYEATIRRTTDGVPHISADDMESVLFGQGWVSGEDHACTLMDQVLKVYGVRSAHLGPGHDGEHIESDFAWRAIDLASVATADYDTASDDVVVQFEAFTAGWNAHLASAGTDGLSGWCAGADWVRPLQPVEVYVYTRSLALLASSARLTGFIAAAQPPAPEDAVSGIVRQQPAADGPFDLAAFAAALDRLAPVDVGSNAWAIGRERVESGTGGALVANPHFPWEGELRFAEVHLTVPGEVDLYGAQLLGVPGVGIGFNDGVAWTHTVSAGKRMTAYLLTLDPASPTSYLVDGAPVPMTSTDHTIEILRPDGTIDSETRTLWRTEHGPVIDFPGIGWTEGATITFRDANLENDEFIEQYVDMNRATTLVDLIDAHAEHQGVPLFNTIAVGSDGAVWYADTSATPNLSAEAEDLFAGALLTDPVTQVAYDNGFVLLDGADSRFDWQEVPGARDLGLVPFEEMPQVVRADYVFNANDSFWVPSAEFLLAGDFSILHGEQGTPLSMRTRQNAAVLERANSMGLSGADGLFNADELLVATFDNTAHTALVLRAGVVSACREQPLVELAEVLADDGTVTLPAETIDLTAACDVLMDWDGRYDLDRPGAPLWRETMSRFDAAARTNTGPLLGGSFDPGAPTTSPVGLADDPSAVLQALGRAVQTLTKAGFPIDSTLGASQFTERSGTRIPLHGGTNLDGTTNIVAWSGNSSSSEPAPVRGEPVSPDSELRGEGYPVNFGTSFVMTVDYSSGPVRAWSLLTYGQTGDRTSPLFESQTVRFSEKNWRQVAFTDEQIAADPALDETVVMGN